MEYKVNGINIEVTESMQSYLEKKCERLEKYFETEAEVIAKFSTEKDTAVFDIVLIHNSDTYRAEAKEKDMYAAIDRTMDILEGQIRKTKTKHQKQIKDNSIRAKTFEDTNFDISNQGEIVKVKYYEIKPISLEDAKLKLEEAVKKQFLLFVNIDTGKVNAIYKTKDGNYGVVEPE